MRKDAAILDCRTNELVCQACGAREPGPRLPMPIKDVARILRGFATDHRKCAAKPSKAVPQP